MFENVSGRGSVRAVGMGGEGGKGFVDILFK